MFVDNRSLPCFYSVMRLPMFAGVFYDAVYLYAEAKVDENGNGFLLLVEQRFVSEFAFDELQRALVIAEQIRHSMVYDAEVLESR
mgnify:CR=1 FL=1